mgnify:FL=1
MSAAMLLHEAHAVLCERGRRPEGALAVVSAVAEVLMTTMPDAALALRDAFTVLDRELFFDFATASGPVRSDTRASRTRVLKSHRLDVVDSERSETLRRLAVLENELCHRDTVAACERRTAEESATSSTMTLRTAILKENSDLHTQLRDRDKCIAQLKKERDGFARHCITLQAAFNESFNAMQASANETWSMQRHLALMGDQAPTTEKNDDTEQRDDSGDEDLRRVANVLHEGQHDLQCLYSVAS